MRKLFILLLLILPAFASLASETGKKEQYKLNVQDFNELSIVDGVPVEYFCSNDSAGWAVFICAPEMASHIMFSNENKRLSIRTDSDEKAIAGIPKIRVFSSSLKKVVNSGDSLTVVNLENGIHVKNFKARQIGNGRIAVNGVDCDEIDAGITAGNGHMNLSGKARKAKLGNTGNGHVYARDLETANTNCNVFGTGNIECNSTESLRVFGAGNGKVIYVGDPKITLRSIGVKAVQYSKDTAGTLFSRQKALVP